MATHLSESSVNSLLRFINQADNTGSYTEKVNLLKKSGILVGGNEYRNVLNKETAVIVFDGNDDLILANRALDTFNRITKVMWKNAATPEGKKKLQENLTAIANGQNYADIFGDSASQVVEHRNIVSEFMKTAEQIDKELEGNLGHTLLTAAAILSSGIALPIAWLRTAKNDTAFAEETKTKIGVLLADVQDMSFDLEYIAYTTSNRLKTFFGDGLYNFTYITYPTKTLVNGISGTGICQIFSYYDEYTNLLVKKELDQSTTPLFSLKLQSFDIMTKYITMATNGSSSVGNFRFISDTICIVMYYGYSSLFGKFYTCKTVIQKTPLGFAIKSSIVNSDHSTTLYYAALYTRVSLPLEKIKGKLDLLRKDPEGMIFVKDGIDSVKEAVKELTGNDSAGLAISDKLKELVVGAKISPPDLIAAVTRLLGHP